MIGNGTRYTEKSSFFISRNETFIYKTKTNLTILLRSLTWQQDRVKHVDKDIRRPSMKRRRRTEILINGSHKRVEDMADFIKGNYQVKVIQEPESGLVMLK